MNNIYTQSKFETNTFQKLSKRSKAYMLDDENVSTGQRKMCKKGWACERNAKRMSWEDV